MTGCDHGNVKSRGGEGNWEEGICIECGDRVVRLYPEGEQVDEDPWETDAAEDEGEDEP